MKSININVNKWVRLLEKTISSINKFREINQYKYKYIFPYDPFVEVSY